LLPLLSVSILYTGQDGLLRSLPLGLAVPTGSWQPSLPMLTLSGLPLLTGSRLGLRIIAIGGPIAIDDVYVDPFLPDALRNTTRRAEEKGRGRAARVPLLCHSSDASSSCARIR